MYRRFGLFSVIIVLMFSAIPYAMAGSDCDFSYSNHARAAQLHDMGDYVAALHHYECAIEQHPDSEILQIMLDRLYQDMTRDHQTQDLACGDDVSYLVIGFNLRGRGELQEALPYLECALQENPYDTALWTSIGNIYRELGDTATAQYFFDHSGISSSYTPPTTQQRPATHCDTGISQFAVGSQYHAMGHLIPAMEAYHCALLLNPDNTTIMVQLAQVYTAMEEYEQALTYLDRALGYDPHNIFFLSQRAYIHYLAGNYVDGLDDVNSVLRWNPDYKDALKTRDLILEAMRQSEPVVEAPSNAGKNALPTLDDTSANVTASSLEAEPTSPTVETLEQAAHVFVGQGRYDLAIEQYEAILGFEPDNADVHFKLGHAHYSLEQFAKALPYLEQSLDLNSDNLYATYYLAMTYSQLDNRVEAMAIIDTLYNSNHYDGSFGLVMGHVFRNLGYDDIAATKLYQWMTSHQTMRLPASFNPETNNTELVMDYGIIYEIPFAAIAGTPVDINALSHILNPAPIDPLIIVLNPEGIPIIGDDDSGELFDASLSFVPQTTGDYTLLVSHAGGKHRGELQVTISNIVWSADTFRALADVAYDEANYMKAIALINKAISLDGGHVSDFAQLARLYKLIGDLDSAAVVLSQALTLDPTRADLRCELGVIYETWGDFEGALQQFDIILTNDPSNPCAWTHRDAILQQQRIEVAEVDMTEAIAPAQPKAIDELVALAHELNARNKRFSAANTFLQVTILEPAHSEARCELSKIYLDWGNYFGATEQLNAILAYDSDNPCALETLQAITEEAERIFLPMTAQDYINRAILHYNNGKLENAIEAYHTALKIDPTRTDARCKLGIAYADMGDYSQALYQWDLVLSQNVIDSCAGANRNALIKRMRTNNTQANVVSEVTVNADDYIRQADTYVASQQWDNAIDAYQSALQLAPLRTDVRCRLGILYHDLKDYDSALYQFNLILSQDVSDHCARNHRRNIQRILREGAPDTSTTSTTLTDSELDALYDLMLSRGSAALFQEAQIRHQTGDVWTASALLDRYIDDNFANMCKGELRWLGDEYRSKGFTVMGDMMHLKAISDSSC